MAVGVSLATINIQPTVTTSVGGTITARSLRSEALLDRPENGTTSTVRTTGSAGGLIGVDSTNSRVNNDAIVSSTIANGSVLNIGGATAISATGLGEHFANADSYAFGLLAAGISSSRVNNHSAVTAAIGSGVTFTGGSLSISADNDQRQFADTFAGSGGIAAGASASSQTVNNASTTASIGAGTIINLSSGLNVSSFGKAEVNGQVQTFAGGLLAGAGARVTNDVNQTTRATVGNGAVIHAHGIQIDAAGTVIKPDLGAENIRGTTGGLVSGASARSETVIALDTQVIVGDNAVLNVIGSKVDPGELALTTLNRMFGSDRVNFTTGGALSGAQVDSIIRTSQNISEVTVGAGAALSSHGDILLSSRGTGDVKTKANAETFGAATVAVANTLSEILPHNTINVAGGATLRALGDLSLAAGTSVDFHRDQYAMSARTDTFAGSAIPLDSIDSQANLIQRNTINVASGSLLESARDIRLHAERLGLADMDSRAKAVNWMSAASGALNAALGGQEQFGGTIVSEALGNVIVNGTLRTGIQRHQSLTLGALDNDGVPYGWDRDSGTIGIYSASDGVTFEHGLEMLESGLMQQLIAARTNLELYRATNTTLRDFYQSEISRIEGELLTKGLATRETDGSLTTNEVDVITANVHPIWAQAGSIDVRGDQLLGNGIIDAPGDASVTITNHTPAQLNIRGITIPESNGGLYLNGVIVGSNSGIFDLNAAAAGDISGTPTFAQLPATAAPLDDQGNPILPSVTVENTFDANLIVADQYNNPAIVVTGDITNYSGSFAATNAKGDVIYRASIRAANVTTIAGGSVFIDGLTSYSVGGDPYGKLRSLGNGISQYDTQAALSRLLAASSQINLLGDTVIIDAEYLNINGIIQSGKESYSMTLGTSVSNQINSIRRNASGPRLTRLSASNQDFTMFYDRVENKIIVREVRVSGGNIQLTGHILSTGAGEIRVLDGYGDITIDNQTPYDIAIERLDSSQRGAGTLLIADKAKGTPANPQATIVTQSGSYQPDTNWRYGFSVGMKTATRTTTTYGSSSWLGIDALAADPGNRTSGPHTEVLEQPRLMPAGSYFYQADTAQGDYTYRQDINNVEPPRSYKSRQWSTSTWYGKKTNYQTWVDEIKQETVGTHTFRADRPILVQMLGNEQSNVAVTSGSGGRILIEGPILNPTGTTKLTSSAAIVQHNEGATVGGRQIVLSAGGDIRDVRTNISHTEAQAGITATAAGAISIAQASGVLPVMSITSTGNRDVTLSGQAGVIAASHYVGPYQVKGGSITLDGGSGGIGTESRPLEIDSGTTVNDKLIAKATGDIYLNEIAGDLHVDQIESTIGDVTLTIMTGGLLDANDFAIRDERTYEELLNGVWSALGLTEGTGAQAKIDETLTTFAASKTREYQTYWKWRQTQTEPGTFNPNHTIAVSGEERDYYELFYTQEGTTQGLSGSALQTYIDDAITTLENSRTQQYLTLHTTFAGYDRGGYSAGDLTASPIDGFQYTLSSTEHAALVGSIKVWTEEELLNTISAGLMKEVTSTQTLVEGNNIIGRDVNIIVHTAGVGMYRDPNFVDVTPRPLQLTDDQRVALAAAERTDVVFIAGDTVSGNFQIVSDLVGDRVIRTDGGNWLADGFQAGLLVRMVGDSSAATEDGQFVQVLSVTTDTLVLSHRALVSDEANARLTVTPVADDPNAPGVNVIAIEIGQRDDVNMLSAGKLKIAAAGPVFVGSQSDFSLERIETSGILAVKSGGAITNGASNPSAVTIVSDDLLLEAAQGGIGTETLPLRLDLLPGGSLTARAQGDVLIVEQSGDLNIDSVFSRAGAIHLTTLAGSLLDNLGGELNNLKSGQNIVLAAAGGSVGRPASGSRPTMAPPRQCAHRARPAASICGKSLATCGSTRSPRRWAMWICAVTCRSSGPTDRRLTCAAMQSPSMRSMVLSVRPETNSTSTAATRPMRWSRPVVCSVTPTSMSCWATCGSIPSAPAIPPRRSSVPWMAAL